MGYRNSDSALFRTLEFKKLQAQSLVLAVLASAEGLNPWLSVSYGTRVGLHL